MKNVEKIRLQKMIYFLQEAQGVPTKLSFRMHHYGPFSEDIETDTAWLKLAGYIEINPDPQGHSFHIVPVDAPSEEWNDVMEPYKESIGRIVDLFENRSVAELELFATMHYVKCLQPDLPNEKILDIITALKPKFDEGYVAQMHAELEQLWISS